MKFKVDISIVVPLYNEVESLPELFAWIKRVMDKNKFSFEVVFIDDGSKDGSWNVVQDLSSEHSQVVGIKFQRNYGKSAALQKGFEAAAGEVVITMDADLQDSPDEIPELYRMIIEDDLDVVSGWKKKRYDPISKTIPTKLYNWAARRITGIKLHDFNCGLKAYKNVVIKSIELYGDMHRYIPPLAKYAGFNKIGEKVVQHQARKGPCKHQRPLFSERFALECAFPDAPQRGSTLIKPNGCVWAIRERFFAKHFQHRKRPSKFDMSIEIVKCTFADRPQRRQIDQLNG